MRIIKSNIRNFHAISSPIGELILIANDDALTHIIFEKEWREFQKKNSDLVQKKTALLKQAEKELKEYFAGTRKIFDISLEPSGTDFQRKVWSELRKIPFGKTISYQEQSVKMRKPKAVRAVGAANGKNPIPIIVPCHRVIGKSGKLTGYAGGLDIKTYLLELESSHV